MKCKNCGNEFEGSFCTNCGTAAGVAATSEYATRMPCPSLSYKLENVVIKAGFLTDAQDKIQKKVQPMLDLGAKKGWKLHTFTSTASAKGINICLVWEIN
ncbi:MAG: hypothetical protein VB078_00660 [Clostridiaceae bacterium]|nr:hypothetical protein [Clostridiaceae bacterium]